MKAGKAVAGAVKDAKNCCQILIGDLTNVKDELIELKDCGSSVAELCKDKPMIKTIGE